MNSLPRIVDGAFSPRLILAFITLLWLGPTAIPSHAGEESGTVSNATATGRVTGRIFVDGIVPALLPAPGVTAGRFHSELTQRETPFVNEPPRKMRDQSLLVSADGGLANAVVYLKATPKGFRPEPAPNEPFVLTNDSSGFSPRVAITRAGQPVWLKNADSQAECFKSTPLRNAFFNVVVAPGKTTPLGPREYGQSERTPVEITSQIQFWKKAYVLRLDHPFAAMTDAAGRYEIMGLPPGQHEIIVWHERTGSLEKPLAVNVKAGSTSDLAPLHYDVARFKPQELATGVASRWVEGGAGWSLGIQWTSGRNEFVVGKPERNDAVTFQLSIRNNTDRPQTVSVPDSLTWDLGMQSRSLLNVRIRGRGERPLTLAAREVKTLDVPQPTLNLTDVESGYWRVQFTTPFSKSEPTLDMWLDSPTPRWLTEQAAKLRNVSDHPDDQWKDVRWGQSLQGLRLGVRVASDPVNAVRRTSVPMGPYKSRQRLTWLESQSVKLVPEVFVWNTTDTEVEIAISSQASRDWLHRLIPDEGAHLRIRPSGPPQIGPDPAIEADVLDQRHRLTVGSVLRIGATSLQIIPPDSNVPLDHQTAKLPAHEYGYQMLVEAHRTDQPQLRLRLPSGIQRLQTVLQESDLQKTESGNQ